MPDVETIESLLEWILQSLGDVTGVLHVGAHTGEEADLYQRHGIDKVTWIEADPTLKGKLEANVAQFPGHRVIMSAVGSHPHRGQFHRTSNAGASSSLKPLAEHSEIWPDVLVDSVDDIQVTTLDLLHNEHDFRGHNLWVLDVQGSEVDALRGASTSLAIADYVLCEFTGPMYQRGSYLSDIDAFMTDFTAATVWVSDAGFGEVFYRRIRRSGMGLLTAAK